MKPRKNQFLILTFLKKDWRTIRFLVDGFYVSLLGIEVIIKNVIFENFYQKEQMISNLVGMSAKSLKCLKIIDCIVVKKLEYRNV